MKMNSGRFIKIEMLSNVGALLKGTILEGLMSPSERYAVVWIGDDTYQCLCPGQFAEYIECDDQMNMEFI